MIPESFEFWNGFTYRHCMIPLLNQGFVYLTGPNGTGKSTPWEVFQHTLYGTTTKGLKKNAIVCTVPREDPDEETGFLSEIIFRHDAGPYIGRWMIRESRDHSKYDTAVKVMKEVDGEFRLKWPGGACPKGLDAAQKFGAQVFALKQNEFEGCMYLSQAATHTLIEGKPADKIQYLAYLFGADRYDQIVKVLKVQLAEVDAQLIGVPNLEGKLEQLAEQLAEVLPSAELEEKVTSAGAVKKLAEGKLKKWRMKRDDARDSLAKIEQREELEEERAELGEVDVSKFEKTKKQLNAAIELRDETRDAIKETKRRTSLREQVTELLVDIDESQYEDIDQQIEKANLRRGDLKALITGLKERKTLKQHLETIDDDLDAADIDEQIAFIEKNLAAQRQKYKDDMARHEKLEEDIESGICPQCKRPFDESVSVEEMQEQADALAEELQTLYAAMDKPKKNLKRLKSQLDEARDVAACKAKLADLPKGDLKAATAERAELKTKLEELTTIRDAINEAATLRVQLSKIRKQDPEKLEADLLEVVDQLQTLTKTRDAMKEAIDLGERIAKLPELSRDTVERDLEIAEESHAELEKSLEQLQRDVAIAGAALATRRELERSVADVEEQIGDTEKLSRRQQVIQYAIKSVVKLKKRKLHKIVCAIRDVLPRYAGVMFSHEPNTKFIVDDDNGSGESLDLIARRIVRIHGRPMPVLVPVKGFSGGEKQRLSVALLFTLHSLLDPTKKPDVLILDEVDKGLDDIGVASLMTLIGEVKDKYGTVIMTSHRAQIAGARFDRVWRASKANEVSQLKL
jgi:DNA repair exonuclease SbcCD ATPase subunit